MASDRAQQGSASSNGTETGTADEHQVQPRVCQASDIPESLIARISVVNENANVDGDALLRDLEADMAQAPPLPPQGGNAHQLAPQTLVGMGAHMETKRT